MLNGLMAIGRTGTGGAQLPPRPVLRIAAPTEGRQALLTLDR